MVIAVNFDHCVRADNCAHSATRAIGVVCLRGKVAVLVGVLRDNDAVFRAYYHAQATTFAPFSINYYFAGHCVFRI
jgi:hypothetical protein